MAVGDPFYKCNASDINLHELFNSLLAKETASGTFGLRVFITDEDPADLENGINCNMPVKSIQELMKQTVVIDAEGKPALRMFNVAP